MKKQILFLCSDMRVGGFQKSLISLFQCLDYGKYDVDLLLLNPMGIFMDLIPKEVTILPCLVDSEYFMNGIKAMKSMLRKGKLKLAFSRAVSCLFWPFNKGVGAMIMVKAVPKLNKHYDVAIDYNGQHLLYYMVEKISANKKISYFHSDYKKWRYYEKMDRKYYNWVDAIVSVSDECVQSMKEIFPEYEDKIWCIENINSNKTVNLFPINSNTFNDSFDGIRIVTVGRVCYNKGYDIAAEALKKLKDAGYDVRWYMVGPIEDDAYCAKLMTQYVIGEDMMLLGATNNPYDYMRNADVIVHPSRFEGKAVAVEEAKILNKPIVATAYSTVMNQIVNEHTGLIVEMTGEAVFRGIERLICEPELRNRIIDAQKAECKGNEDEIWKLYKLIEDCEDGK